MSDLNNIKKDASKVKEEFEQNIITGEEYDIISKSREFAVIKANELIQQSRSELDLTSTEMKIVNYLVSKIVPTDTELKTCTFSINEFCNTLGISSSSGGNYRYIKNALKRLADKSFWIKHKSGGITLFRWIDAPIINQNSGVVTLKLNDELQPYLLGLKEHFTRYSLLYTLNLKSKYSIQIYEIMKSYSNLKTVTLDLDELKQKLNAESYTNFKNFRIRVLEVAENEINEHSDIYIRWEGVKKGRKIIAIKFTIQEKYLMEDQDTFELQQANHDLLDKHLKVDETKQESVALKTAKRVKEAMETE